MGQAAQNGVGQGMGAHFHARLVPDPHLFSRCDAGLAGGKILRKLAAHRRHERLAHLTGLLLQPTRNRSDIGGIHGYRIPIQWGGEGEGKQPECAADHVGPQDLLSADQAGGEEQAGGQPQLPEHGEGTRDVVAVAVIEGDDYRARRDGLARANPMGQLHQRDHVETIGQKLHVPAEDGERQMQHR
ncbi:MAG: hypothetical protein BWY79_02180 [Actinobacteria bacterium ADurb.Bin444]|nr:MAG: hypothetical protein BWY79_02180 [Actinobacteria bacterium ADurb.Bin444]